MDELTSYQQQGMQVEVRPLTEADAKAFWNLRLRALKEHPDTVGASFEEEQGTKIEDIIDRFRNQCSSLENFILGSFINTELVGIVGFRREQSLKTRHKGWVWGLYVLPRVRQQRVGKALMLEVIARAKALPELEQIHIRATTHNTKAKHLYEALGFELYGIERRSLKLSNQYFDDALMVLYLTSESTPLPS